MSTSRSHRHSHGQRTRAIEVNPSGRSVAPDGTQLRNSCQACAFSKLKCSKDKPACDRCNKRSITCEYIAIKRAGRKPNSSRVTVDEASSTSSGSDSQRSPEPVPISSVPSTEPVRSSSDFQDYLFAFNGGSEWEAILSSTLTEKDVTIASTFGDMDKPSSTFADMDNTSKHYMPLPEVQSMESYSTDQSLASTTMIDDCSFSHDSDISADILKDLLSFAEDMEQPNNIPTMSEFDMMDYQPIETTAFSEMSCMCMARALASMKQADQLATAVSTTPPGRAADHVAALRIVLDVIEKNKGIVQAVDTMLKCPALHDGYLLTLISLIIFRVLNLYGSILCKSTEQQNDSQQGLPRRASSTSCLSDSSDSARTAAQLLVGELRHLRHVIEKLGDKLQLQIVMEHSSAASTSGDSTDLYAEVMSPLSTAIYTQLDVNLTRRLKGLSWGIIDQLSRVQQGF